MQALSLRIVVIIAIGASSIANSQMIGQITDSDFAGFVLKNTNQLRYEIAAGKGYRLQSLLFAIGFDYSKSAIECLQETNAHQSNSFELFRALNEIRISEQGYDNCH